jgi:hypothetical protein
MFSADVGPHASLTGHILTHLDPVHTFTTHFNILICNEEFYNLCSSPNIIRMIKSHRMRWAGHVAHMGCNINSNKLLLERCEQKRPLGSSRCRRQHNIEMNLKETVWEGMDWIHLAQGRGQWWTPVNTVMRLQVSQNAGNFLSG